MKPSAEYWVRKTTSWCFCSVAQDIFNVEWLFFFNLKNMKNNYLSIVTLVENVLVLVVLIATSHFVA